MTYDDIAAHFLVPSASVVAAPTVPATPARRLRDAIEPIATIGWWSRAAAEGSLALGLDFFGGYVWGRAAALGDAVDPSVVVAAFGVFEPALLTAVLGAARSTATRADVLAARSAGASAGLTAATVGVDLAVIERLGARLLAAHAGLDGAARPLFGSLRSLPVPDDAHGAAWRAAELVREHRGDGHLAACVAAGLDIVEMNVLTELWLGYPVGEYSATRGFGPEPLARAVASLAARGWLEDGSLTEAGRAARDEIEAATDRSQDGLIAALGDDLDEVVRLAETVGAAVLQVQAAPADPRKRAAG